MHNNNIIAEIQLAPGEVGYYDDYSRIYLTSANNTTVIYAGTNCYQIKKSIKSGRLKLVRGSLSEPINKTETEEIEVPKNNIVKDEQPVVEKPAEIEEPVQEEPVQEEPKNEVVEEKETTETVVEETNTVVEEEVKPVKKTRRKSTTKETKTEEN